MHHFYDTFASLWNLEGSWWRVNGWQKCHFWMKYPFRCIIFESSDNKDRSTIQTQNLWCFQTNNTCSIFRYYHQTYGADSRWLAWQERFAEAEKLNKEILVTLLWYFENDHKPYTCGEQVSGFNERVVAVDTTNAMRNKSSSLGIKPAGSRQRRWESTGCTSMERWRREEKINCVMAEYQLP